MISHKHKFVFIHIPKTGGTSIELCFDPNADVRDTKYKHRTLRGLEKDGLIIKDYFKFTFVRNPWDMTLSMYKYLWSSDKPFPKYWRTTHKRMKSFSFREWVTHPSFQRPTLRAERIHLTSRSYNPPECISDWYTSKSYKIDYIGKFENLQEDFNTVCDKIGIPRQELPHENKTKHKHYTEYYDEETKQIVAEKYAKDIEYFGYEFGE